MTGTALAKPNGSQVASIIKNKNKVTKETSAAVHRHKQTGVDEATFIARLNLEPSVEILAKTPDKKADHIPISYIESMLDELFFGQWSTENYRTERIGNEIIGQIELVCINPITGYPIRRTGCGSVQITVDKAPEGLTQHQRNQHAQDISNKKANALHLASGKLKVECIKNAAKSLGKAFGRDLNRQEKADYVTPIHAPDHYASEEQVATAKALLKEYTGTDKAVIQAQMTAEAIRGGVTATTAQKIINHLNK